MQRGKYDEGAAAALAREILRTVAQCHAKGGAAGGRGTGHASRAGRACGAGKVGKAKLDQCLRTDFTAPHTTDYRFRAQCQA